MNPLVKRTAACAALAAALLLAPNGAWAMHADTAPLFPTQSASTQTRDPDAQRLESFGSQRSCLGVTASKKWLRQARIGGLMLNLRFFTPQGEGLVFEEKLVKAETGERELCLLLHVQNGDNDMYLQLDQYALDVLKRVGVTQLVVADEELYVRQRYDVAELLTVREALELGAKEQLCVGGENDPVTVVSEDGVRRQVNP